MGLAKPPCCHDAGGLLHHRFSFSLYALRRRWESSFLRRFPSDHSARPLAGIPPSGARTFLTRAASSTSRDRLTHSAVQECSTPPPQATAEHKRSHDKPRNQEPPMRYNSSVDGQRRQSRHDCAPHPSVYSVRSRLLPEAGCRHFFMYRQLNSKRIAKAALRAGTTEHLGAKCKKGPVHCGRAP